MTDDAKSAGPPAMLSRFTGSVGRALLSEVLSDTTLLRGLSVLDDFTAGCDLMEVSAGTQIVQQGGADNDIYIIISGSVDVAVNGRQTSTRLAGQHFGEMALIDPTARRSATVTAADHVVLLKCSEQHFSSTAQTEPKLWRRVAVELSRRLHERNRAIRPPRAQPVLFVGCSTEALPLAREVQAAFEHDLVVVEIWTDGVFNPSKTPIEDLTDLMRRIDFAIILLTPDDRIESRGHDKFGPRDNVVFELGLAIGALGRDRTLLMTPRGVDFKLPTDLLGVKPIEYNNGGDPSTIQSRLGPPCNEIRKVVTKLGPI